MKFSIINATVLCFAALSIAAPLMNADDISDLVERNAALKAAKKVQGGKPKPSLSVPKKVRSIDEFSDLVERNAVLKAAKKGGNRPRSIDDFSDLIERNAVLKAAKKGGNRPRDIDDFSDLVERNAAAKAAKKVQGGKPRPSLSVPKKARSIDDIDDL